MVYTALCLFLGIIAGAYMLISDNSFLIVRGVGLLIILACCYIGYKLNVLISISNIIRSYM